MIDQIVDDQICKDCLSFSSPSLPRQEVIGLVRKWGGMNSDAVLDPECKFFTVPGIKGFIGYRLEANCAVVFGDPVCSFTDMQELTSKFHHALKMRGTKIIYIAASEKFSDWAIGNVAQSLVEYGEELFLDPHSCPMERQGTHASLIRRKVKHAIKEGVKIKEYVIPDRDTEQMIEKVGNEWLKSRRGPQIHISHIYLFHDRQGKRWFYAQKGDDIVGVIVLNELQSKQGWLLNHLMITPSAPHGTPEILVVNALEALKLENCHYVSFGAIPSRQLGKIEGLGSISSYTASFIYKIVYRIFHLGGHKMFWGKFNPQTARSYLLFSHSSIGIKEIYALKRAMNVSL